MTYFSRRNKLVEEYSGYQEASNSLRSRLLKICRRYLASGRYLGVGQEDLWVRGASLEHELYIEMTKGDINEIILDGSYDEVFTAVEIFLKLAEDQASGRYRRLILPEVIRAFNLSGSVYFVDDEGIVNLRVEEKLAEKLAETQEILKQNESAYIRFFEAAGNLMGRRDSPQNIVKDLFVAFEDYFKSKTGEKDYGQAVGLLHKKGLITSTQKALLEKIFAYRSDSYGTAHAGKSKTPDEVDALWFMETIATQLKFIDRRLKNNGKS